MADNLIASLRQIEAALPSDDQVLLVAATNPLAFLAIHGVCASDYIALTHKARTVLTEAIRALAEAED